MLGRNKSKSNKPRRRSRAFAVINGLLTLAVLGILVAGGLVVYGAREFYAPGPFHKDRVFEIKKGESLATISDHLEQQGVVDNAWIFRLGTVALKKSAKLRHGEYRLPAGASMANVLKEVTEGKPIQYSVTIPEGKTSAEVVDILKADPDLSGDIAETPPEGSLLPNTYSFEKGATRQSVILRMQTAQKKALADIWANRAKDLPVKTPEELVTLASIVEKETGVPGERPKVAAVFVNRLKRHMRLQSDPTIIYGITKGQGPLGRGLKQSEIEAKTAYNTYQIDGLPPTPIANPGVDSLKAAANPADTKDLYFVAAGPDPSDGHLFAATYAEHRKNVAKWRKVEAEQAKAAKDNAQSTKDALQAKEAAAAGDRSSTGSSSGTN